MIFSRQHRTLVTTLLLTALLSPAAMAHPGHGTGTSLVAGMLHPLTGLDHVLFIVAAGAWAAQLALQSRVLVLVSLAAAITFGALLPLSPFTGTTLEMALALTVVGSGLLLALGRKLPLALSGTLIFGFATVHGMAHGLEGPQGTLAYVPGLALSTATLAAAAAWTASTLLRSGQYAWMRVGGVVSALSGAAMLV